MASTTTPEPDDFVLTLTDLRDLSDIVNQSASNEYSQELVPLLSVNLKILNLCTPELPKDIKARHITALLKIKRTLQRLGVSTAVVDAPLRQGVERVVSQIGNLKKIDIKQLNIIARLRQAYRPAEEYECGLLDQAFRKASRQLLETAKQKLDVSDFMSSDWTWLLLMMDRTGDEREDGGGGI